MVYGPFPSSSEGTTFTVGLPLARQDY
jgi:hypothetical protein